MDGIVLTMTSSTPLARTGSNAVFTLTVRNESSLVAVGVTVCAPLPTGYSLVAANDPRFEKCTGTWSVGSIQPGAESVVQVTALKLPTGSLTYRAQVLRRSGRRRRPVDYLAPMVCSPIDDPLVTYEDAFCRERTTLPHY